MDLDFSIELRSYRQSMGSTEGERTDLSFCFSRLERLFVDDLDSMAHS
jgi:hypothetical protein